MAKLVEKFQVEEQMIAKYIEQVLLGLQYLHGEGIRLYDTLMTVEVLYIEILKEIIVYYRGQKLS